MFSVNSVNYKTSRLTWWCWVRCSACWPTSSTSTSSPRTSPPRRTSRSPTCSSSSPRRCVTSSPPRWCTWASTSPARPSSRCWEAPSWYLLASSQRSSWRSRWSGSAGSGWRWSLLVRTMFWVQCPILTPHLLRYPHGGWSWLHGSERDRRSVWCRHRRHYRGLCSGEIMRGQILNWQIFSNLQVIAACQFVYEEKFIAKYNVHPLKVVGSEGIFGFIALILIQVLDLFPSTINLTYALHYRFPCISSLLMALSLDTIQTEGSRTP